jgi:hypothetical protein
MSKASTIYEWINKAIETYLNRRLEGWNCLSIGSIRIGGVSQIVDSESGCFTKKGQAVRRFIAELGKLKSISALRTVELEVGYYRDEQDGERNSDQCYSITFVLEFGQETGKLDPLSESVMGFAQMLSESSAGDTFVECLEGSAIGISSGDDHVRAGHPIL